MPESALISSPLLSEDQLGFLRKNGFVTVPRITSLEEVSEMREIIAHLFGTKAGHDQGAHFNFAGAEEDPDAPNIPQIVGPQNFARELKRSEFRRNATELARQILGPQTRFHTDHTLVKPPINGAATLWHQDEAFKGLWSDYREVSFWMPLQAVNELNGCMEFIPGSHEKGILPHRTPNDDARVHALECYEGFDPADAVTCPLPAGGCTIHFGRTLHGAGPNRSNDPRYAYVLIFHVPPEENVDGEKFSVATAQKHGPDAAVEELAVARREVREPLASGPEQGNSRLQKVFCEAEKTAFYLSPPLKNLPVLRG